MRCRCSVVTAVSPQFFEPTLESGAGYDLRLDTAREREDAGSVVNRGVPTPEEGEVVWVCSRLKCDFALLAARRPPNHKEHPADPMVREDSR